MLRVAFNFRHQRHWRYQLRRAESCPSRKRLQHRIKGGDQGDSLKRQREAFETIEH